MSVEGVQVARVVLKGRETMSVVVDTAYNSWLGEGMAEGAMGWAAVTNECGIKHGRYVKPYRYSGSGHSI